MKIKLIKNKKVIGFPRAINSVRNTLDRASNFCNNNRVDKIIVICSHNNGTNSFYSKQTNAQSVYLLEQVKLMIFNEE